MQEVVDITSTYATVNGERFAGLNFCGFHYVKFTQENFHGALRLKHLNIIQSLYNINKYSRKNFWGTLEKHENRESLAQTIFPCLRVSYFSFLHDL